MDLYIILPGKIGDIIICTPIAKHYHDMGYNIIWPVYKDILSNFTYGHIPYVTYTEFTTASDIHKLARDNNGLTLDLSLSGNYELQNKFSFDEYRYNMSGVCFNNKWCLDLNRNHTRENQLIKTLDTPSDYILRHSGTDRCRVVIDVDTSVDIIDINFNTDCIFDWIPIIHSAKVLMFVESCFSNLTDQLGIRNDVQMLFLQQRIDTHTLTTGRKRCLPVLKNRWFYNA